MKTTSKNFKSVISQYFNEKQQLAIRDSIFIGFYGDFKVEFSDGCADSYAFMTKCISAEGHFKGHEITKVFSEISKIIKSTNAGEILSIGKLDGEKGNFLFIRSNNDYKALTDWAMDFNLSAQNAVVFYPKEIKELENRLNTTLSCQSYIQGIKDRISFLKNEISKAERISR